MAAFRRPGIRSLLLALLLPGIVAVLAIDGWIDYRAVSQIVQEAYDQALLEPVQALDDSVHLGPDARPRADAAFSVESMFEVTRSRHKYLHIVVTHGDDAPLTLIGVDDLPPPPPAADGRPVFYDAVYRDAPLRVVALRRTLQGADAQPYRVLSQAAESIGPRQQAGAEAWHQAVWSSVRLVGVMVLLVFIGVAWALRPLERLRRSLSARTPAQLEPLDAREVPHEVAPLVEAVNHHIADHRRMLADQSRFLADASHQLRTPLAIMLTQAGYAVREHEAEPMRETLHAIIDQLTRARRLSEQLLAMAHASDTHTADGTLPRPICDLNAVARAVVLQYLPLAREKNQDLGWVDVRGDMATDDDAPGSPPVAPVAAHAAEIHEVLANLVHNAIKYTPAHGQITVSVRLVDGWAQAQVCDTGPGIAAGRRAEVFERFHRGSAEDSRDTRGAGLGLAIARAYAARNGAEILLADGQDSRGLCASLRLRLASGSNVRDNTYFEGGRAH
ncbi:sensor histidine kinase [Variovorax humicola]|uniref:histidine kinase n=1 Tax=Variovorax humicola TaxID=1769758 RepID=A0ABU8VRU9_9BURK